MTILIKNINGKYSIKKALKYAPLKKAKNNPEHDIAKAITIVPIFSPIAL